MVEEQLSVNDINARLVFVLGIVNDHLTFAEAKNGVLLALSGAGAVGLVAVVLGNTLTLVLAIYLWALMVGCSVAVVAALVSFLPQTHLPWLSERRRPVESDNLLFFGHIQNYEPREYLKRLAAATGSDVERCNQFDQQLAEQIVINSRIAARKFTWFRYASWLLLSALVTPIGSYLIYEWIGDEHAGT